ncbi:hypothetical protein Bca101_027436 [Brassica carinata]
MCFSPVRWLKKFARSADTENIRSFPWVLWHIWKARNSLFFEQTSTSSYSILDRAREETDLWFHVNFPPTHQDNPQLQRNTDISWKKPEPNVVKCNTASSWLRLTSLAYSNVASPHHAGILSLHWAVESMRNLQRTTIIFEFSSVVELRDVLQSPSRCQEHQVILGTIHYFLSNINSWCLRFASPSENTAAREIATSVTRDNRSHSYVAANASHLSLFSIDATFDLLSPSLSSQLSLSTTLSSSTSQAFTLSRSVVSLRTLKGVSDTAAKEKFIEINDAYNGFPKPGLSNHRREREEEEVRNAAMNPANATAIEAEGGENGVKYEVGNTYEVKLTTGIEFKGIVLAYDSDPPHVVIFHILSILLASL